MSKTTPPTPYVVEGIEVVELSDIDAEFTFDDTVRQGPAPTLDATVTAPAKPEELSRLALFNGAGNQELELLAPQCQSIRAIPGYVLVSSGRLNSKTFFVLEGQLRVYPQNNDKRPIAIADVGQSTGLRTALLSHPANHSVIATEVSHLIAIELTALEESAKRSHVVARNYAELLASYIRSDNCLHVGLRAAGSTAREGYVDPLTLLHNEHWLATVLPRLVARCQLANKPLAVTAFAINELDALTKKHDTATALHVLQAVCHWLLDVTRPTDLLAVNNHRHLFAFLPDGDLQTAEQLAERLKHAGTTLRVPPAPGSSTGPIAVSFSLVAIELEKGMKDKELLTKAEALIQKSIQRSS